jgi:hypothetical protein
MTQNDVANTRLISQQINATKFKTAKEIVGWMGAMQAQDFNMAKWAVGLRLKNATEQNIDAAINSGEIIRTHLLRPTWHFVSSDDIYWMLELTAPRIKSFMKGRNIQLELSENVLKKANKIIEKLLLGNKSVTRKELINELNIAKIKTDNNRASHILFNAELEGIICSGKMKEKQTTYALLNERIGKPAQIKKEEALYKLASKYFESHSPATLQDFIWWSGLSVSDAKHSLELIKSNFISEKINLKEYWFPDSFSVPKKFKESGFLLPAFDEFLISYKDRSAAIILEHQQKAFSNNGIFWPVIIINGKAVGIWKREIKKDKIIIETNFFNQQNKDVKQIQKAAEKFGYFLNSKAEIILK